MPDADPPARPSPAAPLPDSGLRAVTGSGSGEERIAASLEAALAKHVLEGRASADLAHALLAVVTVSVSWTSIPPGAGLAWLGLFVVTAGARAFNRTRVMRDGPEARATLALVRRDVWIAASLWAGWALLHIGSDTDGLLFLLLIFAGLVAAGTSTLVADARSFFGFMGLLFGPLVLAVLLSGWTREHASMLLLVALFAPFMGVVHRRAHEVLVEQIRARERLALSQEETGRSRDFLDSLIASAPSSVVVLDGAGAVVRVNPAFDRSFGFAGDAVMGRPFLPLVTDERDRPALAAFLETIQEGRTEVSELLLRRSDGRTMWIRLSGTQVRGAAEGTMVLLGEDVSRQVEAREAQRVARVQAEEAARAKSAFLASMSHEIRTPMNGILGMVEILMDTPLADDQRRTAEVIRSSGEGLLRILNDILDVSKIEAGQLDLETVAFDLHELVAEVGRVFAGSAAAEEDELLVDLGEGVPQGVRGDPHRLRQVLSNLVGNAVKFTRKGEVELSVRWMGAEGGQHRIRFAVRDTGIGIPAEKQEAVFRAFVQADSSTTRTHGGTGLGLSISKRLVELMGGAIALESEPGKGSNFHFELVMEGVEELRPTDTRSGSRTPLSARRFLVVDDNAAARRIICEALAHAGAASAEARSVDEGLAAARNAADRGAPFDAVIVDHMMPGREGFELAHAVYADPRLGSPRVLMVTSAAPAGGAERARALGVGGYLAKPVSRPELLKALSMLLGQAGHDGAERRLVTRETISRVSGGVRILLAEDNPVNQQVAVALLRKRGHEVIAVGDGRQAVEAARRERFDLVLMDIQMPEMDGHEATRAIRRFADAEALPIVALTAHAFAEERERSRAAGMNDFLAKPVRPEDLYGMVERWARRESTAAHATREHGNDGGPAVDEHRRAEPPVDLEGFRALMREAGVEEVVDTAVGVYLDEAPGVFAALEDVVTAGDSEGTRRWAHSLKSSSGSIRANRLYGLLQAMEGRGRGGDAEGARAALAELRGEFDGVLEYLRKGKAPAPPGAPAP
ncbi:MAG: response regulator [Gemmatimonadetes bacterium]|nr:response regulator [Gemmatimonadota bacterium]